MPAARTQKDKATTPEGQVKPKIRWSCPFPGCRKTTSKKPDVRRHYRTHFDWVPFQCPFYATCKFQSQQESNVVVHIEQTRMHPEISAADLANAKPVRVLPESSAPQLPPGWDHQGPAPSAAPVKPPTNPRRLPAAVRRTVAASTAPVGSLESFRILSFNHTASTKARSTSSPYPTSNSRRAVSASESEHSSSEEEEEECSEGPSTPGSSPAPDVAEIAETPVYHMTTEEISFPVDVSAAKMHFGETEVKACWTWDQFISATNTFANTTTTTATLSAADYPKNILFDEQQPSQDVIAAVHSDWDVFGQCERPFPELVPGFGTATDLVGWGIDMDMDLGDDKFFPSTTTTAAAAAGLSIPKDMCYGSTPSSPKLGDFELSSMVGMTTTMPMPMSMYEDTPSPVVSSASAGAAEGYGFAPADYSMTMPDFGDELFLDSSLWNQLAPVDWEELARFQASS